MLTFIDGTEVIAAENNTVEFLGEKFTLSGFCKEFMPDEKRSKSNSYRGCAYFFLGGVKLEKLFKDYQKSQAEEVAGVPNDTLDSTAEPTITPGEKIVALNAKETTSGTKVIMIDVGTMAKVVHISLGVPPECTEAVSGAIPVAPGPPNIFGVRPANAGTWLNNATVGCYLGMAGKVVHTLPLPPPGRKRISELTTYTNYCNTS